MGAIEVFDNPNTERDYEICHEIHEFTSVCPKTGHPDFAEMTVTYVPGATCIELKSLKLYLQGYRNEGIFYEAISNRILDDLVESCEPKWMELETTWSTRGGISSVITVEHMTEDEEE